MITKHPPWKHQQAAFNFIVSRASTGGAYLAMAMGTGKSACAINLIQNYPIKLTLVACPKSVIDVWPDEFAKHLTDTEWNRSVIVPLSDGSVQQRMEDAQFALDMLATDQRLVLVINYEAAWREPFRSWALTRLWDLVICDESHRIKSAGGKASRFFSTLRPRTSFCLGLSGTPMPHSPLDVYAQMRFVDPAIFGTRVDAFKSRYCFLGGFSGRQIIGWQHLDELHEKFYQAAFRVTGDVLDLPPEVDEFRTTTLEPKAARHYRELQKDFITETQQGTITASNALVKMLRLQQLAGGWLKHEDGDYEEISRAKQDLFFDTIADLPREEPIVVFCRFHHELDAMQQGLRKRGYICAELSGRRNELKPWQRGYCDVLLAQIQAGSEGNDLTRARYTIYYSQGLSLGNYQQSRKRTSRPGQTAPQTTFIHLLVKGTVDQKIYRTFAKNQDVIQAVLQDGL